VYSEGSTIPVQVDVTNLLPNTQYTVALRYDFVDSISGIHFIDWLTSTNPDGVPRVDPYLGTTTCAGPTSVAIPTDSDLTSHLPPIFQAPGSLTAYNVVTSGPGAPSFSGYSTTPGGGSITKKAISLTFTTTSTANEVVLTYGVHLARDK